MAEINAELQNIIINAYKDIVENGVSLRKVSEDIGIDRKRLKKLMKDILSEEELNKFNTVLDKNNNRKKTGSRNKKSKAVNLAL